MAHLQYLPGDPRLVDQLVYELKSKGIFDQVYFTFYFKIIKLFFIQRKNCVHDLQDTIRFSELFY